MFKQEKTKQSNRFIRLVTGIMNKVVIIKNTLHCENKQYISSFITADQIMTLVVPQRAVHFHLIIFAGSFSPDHFRQIIFTCADTVDLPGTFGMHDMTITSVSKRSI